MTTFARRCGVALATGMLAGVAVMAVAGAPAVAACNQFSLEVSPARVSEGASVKVTVSRDSASAPSSVEVETIDDTARSGDDYIAVKRTIAFTDETEQSFDVAITNDAASESDETFKVHLSNPSGCRPNPNFSVGDDVEVTIAVSDAPRATQATQATQATAGSPAPPTTFARTTSTSAPDDGALPDIVEDDDGISDGAIVAAVIVALAVATAGFIMWRRRVEADGPGGTPGGPGRPSP